MFKKRSQPAISRQQYEYKIQKAIEKNELEALKKIVEKVKTVGYVYEERHKREIRKSISFMNYIPEVSNQLISVNFYSCALGKFFNE